MSYSTEYTPKVYIASLSQIRTVFLFYLTGDGTETILPRFFPKMGLERVIHEDRAIIGQPFQNKYNAPSLEKMKRKFKYTVCVNSISEVYAIYTQWILRRTLGTISAGFFLPSFKKDYNVVSVAGDNQTITVTDNYNSLWSSGINRHVVIFEGPDLTKVRGFRKLTTNNDTQIVLSSSLSGITTSDIIMNLYFGYFENDNFTKRVVSNTQIEMDFSFIEDQVNTA